MPVYRYIFGPVPSRRLGRSLGIDIVPPKLCTLDCIYCEIGRTDKRGLARKEYYPVEEIITEVKQALNEFKNLDHITISGSGEPTLHSKIGEIIQHIKKLTVVPIAVLTNGTLLTDPEVRLALCGADIVSPSLDAVTTSTFEKIDRPHPKLDICRIIEGLIQFRKEYKGQLWIEILFVENINDGEDEIQKMKEVLEQINPDKIHLNTVVRPPAESYAQPVSEQRMKAIKAFLGPKAEIITTVFQHRTKEENPVDSETVLAALERRPMTLDDIVAALSITPQRAAFLIHELIARRQIQSADYVGAVYYHKIKKD